MIEKGILNTSPHIVRVKDFHIDSDYNVWLSEIEQRYRSAQIKSAFKINAEKLKFNWSVGHDLVVKKAEERWGSGVVEQLSFDLQTAFPKEKGFSSRNLWNMKAWFLFFSTPEAKTALQTLMETISSSKGQTLVKLHQLGAEMPFSFPDVLGLVAWRHQINIITKCKTIDSAIYYLKECIIGGWSRHTLDNALKANLYKTKGKAISNFVDYLPEAQCRMAQEIELAKRGVIEHE
ncbi:MAG: hypothetical protein K2L22_05795 [Muribaculaceae bacterium]|nr:hypothetical protein [Muribaculaceae bacterium]